MSGPLSSHGLYNIVQIHKKTLLQKDPVIGQLLLPVISLDLDNRPHEDWFALQTEEDVAAGAAAAPKSLNSPHRFRDVYMTTPSPCWQCNRTLWHDVNGAAQRCDLCGMTSHKHQCAEKIPHNCGSVGSVRVWYSYTREPIMVRICFSGYYMIQRLKFLLTLFKIH